MDNNLELWDQVEKTNPKYTKNFPAKGGGSLTAICAQIQKKKATEIFGLFGTDWGLRQDRYTILKISDDCKQDLLVYSAEFYYKYKDKLSVFNVTAEINTWSYSSKYKNYSPNTDMHKKVRTDALTKALSEIGFNSDVFEGKFDDNKYVADMRNEIAQQEKAKKSNTSPARQDQIEKSFKEWKDKIKICPSVDEITKYEMTIKNRFKNCPTEKENLLNLLGNRNEQISDLAMNAA